MSILSNLILLIVLAVLVIWAYEYVFYPILQNGLPIPHSTTMIPLLYGVPSGVYAHCSFNATTYNITCSGYGNSNTTSMYISADKAFSGLSSTGDINYFRMNINASSFSNVIIDANQFNQSEVILEIKANQTAGDVYFAGSYCLAKYDWYEGEFSGGAGAC